MATNGYSLSGNWSVLSKLAIIITMCLGRHRGLPDNVDQTVRLPTRRTVTRTRIVERDTGHEVGREIVDGATSGGQGAGEVKAA
ncbi:hypothetical protein HKX48_000883, partial [Thoreauomyces humboldtii]